MMSRSLFRPVVASVALAMVPLIAGSAGAQSNLSTQGFGYPTGQLSARAQGTGGALAEMDPLSPINPATIAMFGSRILFFQIEPEYRSVTTAAGTEHTTTARYPNVFGAMPLFSNFIVSLGASTLLDRTATTSFSATQMIGANDSVGTLTTYRVDGAMDDIRLAAAWAPRTWLRVGAGAHAITGHNLVNLSETFSDSLRFASFSQSRVLGFSGTAASAGVQLVSKAWLASASFRAGGSLSMNNEDTTLSRAKVPSRFGASLAYTGVANSSISIRTAHDNWSALNGLGSPGLVGVDAWDTSVGAEIAGPRLGASRIVFLRGGFRDRTLPFTAGGATVSERSFSGGLGTSFANDRVLGDLAVIRANRSAAIGASEHAWTLSLGISIRP